MASNLPRMSVSVESVVSVYAMNVLESHTMVFEAQAQSSAEHTLLKVFEHQSTVLLFQSTTLDKLLKEFDNHVHVLDANSTLEMLFDANKRIASTLLKLFDAQFQFEAAELAIKLLKLFDPQAARFEAKFQLDAFDWEMILLRVLDVQMAMLQVKLNDVAILLKLLEVHAAVLEP